MNNPSSGAAPVIYEIRIRGQMDPRRARWFEGMTITTLPGGDTLLRGPLADQSALHGLLSRIRDLGIPLISVCEVEV
jgi:hypothetical protein